MRPLTRRALESLPGPERTAHTAHSHLCRGQAETCCTDSAWKPHSCPARGLVRPQPARGVGPRVAVETEGGCSRHLEGGRLLRKSDRDLPFVKESCGVPVCVHRERSLAVLCASGLWNRGGLIFCVSQTHSFKTVTAHHQKETVTSHQVRDLQKKILKCKLQNVTVFSR